MGGVEAAGGAGLGDGVGRPVLLRRRPGRAVRLCVPRHLESGAGGRRPGPGGEPRSDRRPGRGGGGRQAPDPRRPPGRAVGPPRPGAIRPARARRPFCGSREHKKTAPNGGVSSFALRLS